MSGVPSGTSFSVKALALARLGPAFAERTSDDLSGGERQSVLVVGALASEAAILIIDEPAPKLRLKSREQVLRLIRRLPRELGSGR